MGWGPEHARVWPIEALDHWLRAKVLSAPTSYVSQRHRTTGEAHEYPLRLTERLWVERAMGWSKAQMHRIYHEGGLTSIEADELCHVLGLHPAVVWPEWDSYAVDDIDWAEIPDHLPDGYVRRAIRKGVAVGTGTRGRAVA